MKKQIPLKTVFSEALSPDSVLSEYPRPSLVRDSYLNLNGLWEYAITAEAHPPLHFDGHILVPFSPEAPLSGVSRQVEPSDFLWYRRTLSAERPQSGQRMLLHFGAVDWRAEVFINRISVGTHQGVNLAVLYRQVHAFQYFFATDGGVEVFDF